MSWWNKINNKPSQKEGKVELSLGNSSSHIDPDNETIKRELKSLVAEDSTFAILSKLSDDAGLTYIQTSICDNEGGFIIEYQYVPTIGFVFAYDSISLPELISSLEKVNCERSLNIDQRIDMILILKKGIIVNYYVDTDQYGGLPELDSKLAYADAKHNLLLFYLLQMSIFSQVWTRPIKVIEYTKVSVPIHYFRQEKQS